MRSDHVEASGEVANPLVQKARRSSERQAASASGIGPTQQPGVPEMPMQGKRRNGNMARDLGGQASPRISRRRGAR